MKMNVLRFFPSLAFSFKNYSSCKHNDEITFWCLLCFVSEGENVSENVIAKNFLLQILEGIGIIQLELNKMKNQPRMFTNKSVSLSLSFSLSLPLSLSLSLFWFWRSNPGPYIFQASALLWSYTPSLEISS
jgi:hypothetical protein